MKKTLIALAALAATGATLAQSSVTIYGRLDLGMSQTEVTERTSEGVTVTDTDSFAGAQDQRTGSRIGFRGTEDLGGGLRAGFVWETSINADRVRGQADAAGTRLAHLSLTGGFGTVVIGTFMNNFDAVRGFSATSGAAPGSDPMVRIADLDPLGGDFEGLTLNIPGRSQNAIAYISPVMNGFTFSVGYLSEDTATTENGRLTGGSDDTGFLLGLNYAHGPLAANFVFGDVSANLRETIANTTTTTIRDDDLTNWAFAVRYDFGFMVPYIIYEQSDIDWRFSSTPAAGTTTTATGSIDFDAWEVGARFPMGAFTPYISVTRGDIQSREADARVNVDFDAWQIGTTYTLSARTWVYASYGEHEHKSANLPAAESFSRNVEGFRLGLVHTF